MSNRESAILGYRQFADYLESHPEVPLPVSVAGHWFFYDKAKFLETVSQVLSDAPAGTVMTNDDGCDFVVIRKFSGFELRLACGKTYLRDDVPRPPAFEPPVELQTLLLPFMLQEASLVGEEEAGLTEPVAGGC